ncbi:2-phosphosulfolactate phosphatase [Luteipulveratus flavus]|uniref:Probable 2-phosphosulfolactate phosphatase n=1 Tax=Luteipulveratus flavus TaxID=3031728 RepID=A0ABT6CBF8_9MICO|nr:2-phosphosulfolactate phosphatase [Luteipulveratus sp. YIM 133296]MDF8266239.1 2-phosphosulfolactate phosphatase [Luteipulveratus sp. YIM 133296]
MGSEHTQQGHRIRLDWGTSGAQAVAGSADIAVVCDVLSFTTTLTVAVDLGAEVYPYAWRDDGVVEYAAARDATYAVGRFEARDSDSLVAVSLSPASLRAATGLRRLVLPSPNGSTISTHLRDRGLTVVGAALRNRTAVATWLATRMAEPTTTLALVAAGERWPDRSLRPSVEDLWGCGAVLSALLGLLPHLRAELSPEAQVAVHAYTAIKRDLTPALLDCASGQELLAMGFRDDVLAAADVDSSSAVPLLAGERFVDAARPAGSLAS